MTEHDRLRPAGAHVISETIAGETVVINLDSGVYFSLGGTASEVWEEIVAGRSPAQIAALLGSRYEGEAAAIHTSVEAFVIELEGDGLVRREERPEESSPPAGVAGGDRAPFEPPTVQRFTDIQELLLLDPIHEVDEEGWPARPADA